MIPIFGLFLVFSRKFALLSSCAAHTTTSAPVVSYPYLMVVTFKDDLTDEEKLILTNATIPYVGIDTPYGTDKFIKADSNPVYVDT
uniref:Uncharacterized protein n=1 Tax=Romanomermis culicivorax TaxID=13658 RepID=A0A915IXV0_ROMCU